MLRTLAYASSDSNRCDVDVEREEIWTVLNVYGNKALPTNQAPSERQH